MSDRVFSEFSLRQENLTKKTFVNENLGLMPFGRRQNGYGSPFDFLVLDCKGSPGWSIDIDVWCKELPSRPVRPANLRRGPFHSSCPSEAQDHWPHLSGTMKPAWHGDVRERNANQLCVPCQLFLWPVNVCICVVLLLHFSFNCIMNLHTILRFFHSFFQLLWSISQISICKTASINPRP